ncbi:Gfo/Idh/MocA family protein [Paenibacillus thermoaerophilus]|uniref:Gfo/Idh/MocA family protein n=1 Tax=Paenibacillus thermoaerophilus TaxID=1215385 RepID=A0ABW2UZ07_9BACL|nr:Gfo/Idh/MocA family oxidoreductase [Paenibacillus thermoaerophilus]TMV15992.1 Gfo/Idh/MocA family oxidoreductase [Paenibacillus thermoaerophilus]
MSKLKIGVIGCGGIAFGKHLPSLSKLEDVELVAFCDIELDRAERAKKEYGAEGARAFTDYRELLAISEIDVVHVCTPNDSHAEITIAALEAGKHVNCEKPMAKTAEGARAMQAAAERTGKLLTISYQNRFRADSQHLKKLVERGDLGEIYYAKAHAIRRRAVPTWGVFLDEDKQGGGPLIDIGTHALDLALWLMDNYEPKVVLGRAFKKLSQRENAANAWGPWDPKKFTVEDSAFGMIVMKNGAVIQLESSWAINLVDSAEAKVTLCGTEAGADMADGLRINGEDMGKLYTNKIELDGKGVAFYDAKGDDPALNEMRQWIDAVRGGGTPVVTPKQALVVSEILEAIYESSLKGEAVSFI